MQEILCRRCCDRAIFCDGTLYFLDVCLQHADMLLIVSSIFRTTGFFS